MSPAFLLEANVNQHRKKGSTGQHHVESVIYCALSGFETLQK